MHAHLTTQSAVLRLLDHTGRKPLHPQIRNNLSPCYASPARNPMRIHLVSLEDGITATGFRKFAAYAEKINPDTRTFYVGTQRYRSMWKSFVRKVGEGRAFGEPEVAEIAQELAQADVVAFSSMTGYADLTKKLATRVREINPKA